MAVEHHDTRLLRRLQDVVVVQVVVGQWRRRLPQVGEGVLAGHAAG